jgi:hypothetical protein
MLAYIITEFLKYSFQIYKMKIIASCLGHVCMGQQNKIDSDAHLLMLV